MNKPVARSGVDYPINQLSSDRRFEKLLHRIFEYRIKDDLKGKFDKATLMQGGSERGRDIILQLNGKVNGLIQCKMNTSGNLSKENVSKEIIKFVLYYYQDNSLVDDLESFTYYFVCSDKFAGPAIELLVDFKSKILEDDKLETWIKSVLRGFSAFKSLDYANIEIELKEILAKLIVKPKTESEINGWLHKKGYENIVREFFEVRTVFVDKFIEKPFPLEKNHQILLANSSDDYIEPKTIYIEKLNINVAVYPVTFKEYDLFCSYNPSFQKPDSFQFNRERGANPVVNVKWSEANKYCEWVSTVTKKIYRLPTFKEWEYIFNKHKREINDISINNLKKWCLDDDGEGCKVIVRDGKIDDYLLPYDSNDYLGFRIVCEQAYKK